MMFLRLIRKNLADRFTQECEVVSTYLEIANSGTGSNKIFVHYYQENFHYHEIRLVLTNSVQPPHLKVTSELGLVRTSQEKFERGVFTLKTHQMFSVHSTPKKFKNAPLAGHFGFFSLRKTGTGKSYGYCNAIRFSKSFVFKMLSVHTKT